MSHILEIFEKTPLTEALYLTYEAKKNAEIAPGVGRGTDMGIIRESSFEELDEVILKKLNDIYEERASRERKQKERS